MDSEHPLPDALKDLVLLKDICDEYLGMTFVVARRRFSLGQLPLRAFRLSDSRRGPLYVHNDDLQRWVDRCRKQAVVAPAHAATPRKEAA